MLKIKLFIALVAIIVISGCVLPSARTVKVEANTGVKINKFIADPVVAEEDEIVRFDLEVENVGGVKANNVEAVLAGLEGVWRTTSGSLASLSDVKKTIGSMDPPRPALNTPGDLSVFTLLLKPPDLPEGVQTDFPVTARVDYDYKTTGTIVIPTISKSLYVDRTRKGIALDDKPNVGNTFAPLQISLEETRLPLVVNDADTTKTTDMLIIDIVNVGKGSPISGTAIGSLTGTIRLLGAGATLKKCLNKDASNNAVTFTSSDVDIVKLRSSNKVGIPCEFEMDITTPTSIGSITFTIDMDYRYFVEETAVVKLYGK